MNSFSYAASLLRPSPSFAATAFGFPPTTSIASSFHVVTPLTTSSTESAATRRSQTNPQHQTQHQLGTSTHYQSKMAGHPDDTSTFATLFPFSVNLNGVDQGRNNLAIQITVGVLGAVLLATLFLRWSKMIIAHFRLISIMGYPDYQNYWRYNRSSWYPWLKKHLLYAPLWNKRHNQEIQLSSVLTMGTLPGRSHFLILIIWSLYNIIWILILPYGAPREEFLAALRGRSGMMAVFNLFPTIVFALRNNPLIPILQVPFDTFQLFHRWAARTFIIETLIHTFAWIVNTQESGGWWAVNQGLTTGTHSFSFAWGMVGTLSAIFILIQAWSPLRHAFYEAFLIMHKLLVFLVFMGVTLHLHHDNLPQKPWMIAIWIIWLYDYCCRAYRMITTNMSYSKGQYHSDIIIEALDGGACRLTIHLPTYWNPQPGAHTHLYIPSLAPLQTHPFSVAWAQVHDLPHHSSQKLPTTKDDLTLSTVLDPGPQRTSISILCRARTGFTKKLYDQVRSMPSQRTITWGFTEGFYYGSHDPLSSYSDVLLFAGGVGITHQLMFAKQLLAGHASRTNGVQKIHLIWSCPERSCLDWIAPWMEEILDMPERRKAFTVDLFITRDKTGATYESESGSVKMYSGRPDVKRIIDRAIVERTGAVAVTVCGPGAFADGVREAARRRVCVGVVDFIEEAFTY